MSLGDASNYNNNNGKNDYRPTVYSGVYFSNVDSEIEKSKLTYTFWKGLLKISIAPIIESKDDSINFDYKNEAAIYLSPQLAYIMYNQSKEFIANPDKYINKGVPTRSGALIKLANGKEYNTEGYVLVIEKIAEDKSIVGGHLFEFNTQKYYGIDDMNEDSFDFGKTYYDQLEIDFLLMTLKSFYESSIGSQAYFMIDYGRFESGRTSGKLTSIQQALGIENKGNNNRGNYNRNSPFDNSGKGNNNSSSGSSSYEEYYEDDIESME